MTNLNKLYSYYDVSTPIQQKALKELLLNHLPKEYTNKVIEKLQAKDVTIDRQTVRNVKAGISKNIMVFNAIIEVAREFKAISDRLKENLQNLK
ncbi:hypothetical protein [Seonamhaeicola sp.]|uniref:hypothetical protein n=1 Tax=Seonamhaeicola sp. TaxID=1912245 RepID=UPI0026269EDF|nr:hypothetical protein [Seonamhaeicola sp.]